MSLHRISVIGAGAWGTALAVLAQRAGCNVTLWARRTEQAADLESTRENAVYLPGVPLDPALRIETDLTRALAADAVLYAQPAQHFRAFCRNAAPLWKGAALVIAAKGIECETGALLNEIAAAELARRTGRHSLRPQLRGGSRTGPCRPRWRWPANAPIWSKR